MKASRLIYAAWVLLLVSALLIGIMAMRLLGEQEARFAETALETVKERAAAVAESIDLAITDTETAMTERLRSFPIDDPERLAEGLDSWKNQNPLVRNVFVWEQDRGFLTPNPARPATAEEASFLRRYEGLFDNEDGWKSEDVEKKSEVVSDEALVSPRRELRDLAMLEATPAAEPEPAPAAPTGRVGVGAGKTIVKRDGWIAWYADDRVGLLGWVAIPARGLRYGLEMEMMGLLSRLLPLLPPEAAPGQVFALVDGSGRVFHQSGGTAYGGLPELTSLPVGPRLPHWTIRVFGDRERVLGAAVRPARFLSFLLAGIFVAAILFGGSLLLWQARRNAADARKKTSFVSNVSHELKTPLTTIRMYAELLQEGSIGDESRRERYLDVITREAQRLTRLVNNVLDFSRLEQGRKEYRIQDFGLAEVLNGVLDTQGPRLEEAGIALIRDIPEEVAVRSDRDALEQTFLNLIDNAVKYAGRGSLAVRLGRDGGICRVSFADSGGGVPREHRERVFDKFFRVDDSLTSPQPGSGLGLSIARQLLRDLGGDVVYVDAPEGGGRFDVLVPVAGGGGDS